MKRGLMKRLPALGLMLGAFVAVLRAPGADTKDKAEAKEALKALQECIGGWKGSGNPEKPRPTSGELWSETVNWSWRFKGDDAWLTMEVKGGKYFQGGEVRYLPARKELVSQKADTHQKRQMGFYRPAGPEPPHGHLVGLYPKFSSLSGPC